MQQLQMSCRAFPGHVRQVEAKTNGFRLWHAYCHFFGGAAEVCDEATVDRIVAPTIS